MTGKFIMMPRGDSIFASGCEVLVNPVDAATGARGAGLAKLFAQRFPVACQAYRDVARRGIMRAGNVWCFDLGHDKMPSWIFFAATKRHWRDDSEIVDVATAARHIRREAIACGVRSVAVPALGCGLGGLAWDEVRPILEAEGREMARSGITVKLYPPHEEASR